MADRAGPDVVRQLLAMLDDEPRWIDVRGMLLGGHAQVTGGGEQVARARDGSGWVVKVLHGAVSVIGVVGRPSREVLAEVVRDVTELTPIVVQTVDASWVAGCLASHDTSSPVWRAERVIAHRLGPAARGAALEGREGRGDVRLLTAADSLAHLPPGLRHELTHARSFAPVAALFEAR